VIASIAFHHFKALRQAALTLAPFNLLIGPNGSGKSTLIQAILRLRTLARLPLRPPVGPTRLPDSPEISFHFSPPHERVTARLSCVHETHCDLLEISPLETGDPARWPALRDRILTVRAYLFDHYAMALPTPQQEQAVLTSNGGNLAAVLAHWEATQPPVFAAIQEEVRRILPEYDQLSTTTRNGGTVELVLRLADGGDRVLGEALSQGTLYLLALITLAHDPNPPALLCIEEVDRGIHPRLLRGVRDVLYRLSYPATQGSNRQPTQVIATTHSPYLLDLFREHPEEIVIAEKHGAAATFLRLSDRADIQELLREGSLGDMWFAGILGGVPDEP
jgi:predicted ATPase